jgi:hypothetical protein
MDPATIGLLISIAPTVLGLLFGQGHIKDSSRKQSMYGYGLEGYGYRYPRRRRKLTVETYYPESVQPELVRAAVFNRAIAARNPWIQHLKNIGVYDEIRKLLRAAKQSYNPKDPTKRQRVLEREVTKLRAELNILLKEAEDKRLAEESARRYPGADYTNALRNKINQLRQEIVRIEQSQPTGQLQLMPPK